MKAPLGVWHAVFHISRAILYVFASIPHAHPRDPNQHSNNPINPINPNNPNNLGK